MQNLDSAQPLNVDLHSHSLMSDGLLPPEQVAAKAAANGVAMWALTDHDELGGLAAAEAAATAAGIRFIPGVEISVSWSAKPEKATTTIHIVGLNVDASNATLCDGLAHTRAGRDERAARIARDLEIVGVPGALEGAKKYAINPNLLSRSHFARFLVEAGKVRDTNAAFRHYLTEGKPGYVQHEWASLAESVRWIRAAGGVAVVAHPGRYRLTDAELNQLFAEFKDLGGEGVEVVTGSHSTDQYNHFAEVARCYGFKASRGSDYHGPKESRFEPGTLPALPSDLVPVWQGW
jgi:3',5'-nucleoside bisphosphate phosphatase